LQLGKNQLYLIALPELQADAHILSVISSE